MIRILTLASLAGLVLAFATAAALDTAFAGGTCHKGRAVTDERGTNVTLAGNCFTPTILRVDEGAQITWTNEDEALHTVTGANFAWGQTEFGNAGDGELAQGETLTQSFDEPGVYPYFCLLHPGMIGVVVVGDGNARGAASDDSVVTAALASDGTRGHGPPSDAASASEATADTDGSGIGAIAIVSAIAAAIALVVGAGATITYRTIAARRLRA